MVSANDPGMRPRPIIAVIVLIPVLMLIGIAGALVCVFAALMGWV